MFVWIYEKNEKGTFYCIKWALDCTTPYARDQKITTTDQLTRRRVQKRKIRKLRKNRLK